ncbi:MAG: hypothetical protein ACMUJM_04675 [bacterium]
MYPLMRKTIEWFFFLFMLVSIWSGYVSASPHKRAAAELSSWDAEISELTRALKEGQSEKNTFLKKRDTLSKKILREKRKSEGMSTRKLDSLLRESQHVVVSLETLSAQIKEYENQLRQKYSAAITALVSRLEKEHEERTKKMLVKQLIKYIGAYEELMEPISVDIPEIDLEIHEYDTQRQISEKADFLSDQTALLKAKMFQIDTHVTKLEKERVLRSKVKKFADEIDFFDDTLFVEEKRVVQQPDVYGTDTGATTSTTTGTNTTDTMGTTSAEDTLSAVENAPLTSVRGTLLSSFMMHNEVSGMSPSDLILSTGSIDEQIELLKKQRIQLGERIHQLAETLQIFHKRSEELNSLQSP